MSLFASGETASASKFNQKTVFVGTAAPGSPADGQLWYDSTNKILKEWHAADSIWHKLATAPNESSLAADFTTSATALTDTGLTVTTVEPSIVLVTIKVVKTGANSTFTLSLNVSAGSAFYVWHGFYEGSNANITVAAFDANIVMNATATSYNVLLVGYASAGATIKVQADVQSSLDSIAVKSGCSLTAYPG